MKTARQLTTRTWFLFVFLFSISLAIPYKRLFDDWMYESHEELPLRVIGALESSIPLILLITLGLCVRRTFWIFWAAFAIRSYWAATVLLIALNVTASWQDWLALSLWPEYLCFVSLRRIIAPGFEILGAVAICGAAYAAIAILLARSCRLRKTIAPENVKG